MKTAIVCDWLTTIGGAEKVLNELLTCYPHADLFAVIDHLPQDSRQIIKNKNVTTTFIQSLPFTRKYYRHFLPLMPLAIEQLDLSAYDLIISNSHAVAKGVITGPNQLHISYVHTPMRYAWDMQHQYLRDSGMDKKFISIFVRYFLHKMRGWDLQTASGVDYFVANSRFIAKRITKTYRRKAVVIYPPVDTENFVPGNKKENFYLCASRLVSYKRIDLIIEAFKNLPDKKLIVIGDGPDYKKLKNKAPANVTLMGYQDNAVLIDHLQRAKAFIFAAEEDFGILPVEAQSCGTPIIAFGKGGALETVRGLDAPKPTGVFFEEQKVAALINAIKTFEENVDKFSSENCVENALQFSKTNFKNHFTQFVDGCIHQFFHVNR